MFHIVNKEYTGPDVKGKELSNYEPLCATRGISNQLKLAKYSPEVTLMIDNSHPELCQECVAIQNKQ